MLKTLAMAVLLASSAQAATPRQFNLACAGETSRNDLQNPGQIIKAPWQGTYSVDLNGKAWCARPACHAYQLASEIPYGIILRDEAPPIDVGSESVSISFDPRRMELDERHWHFKATYFVAATCHYTPFTPLPPGPAERPVKGEE